MENIHKLPFLMGGTMAVVIGLISYVWGTKTQDIYIRMAVAMVVFFVLGTIIKNTLVKIQDEITKKKELDIQKIKEEEALLAAQAQAEAEAGKNPENKHNINLVADDDFDDEFSPLTVSRIIASKAKE